MEIAFRKCQRCRHLLAWGWDFTLGAFAASSSVSDRVDRVLGLTYVCFNDHFKSVSYLLYHLDIRLYCIPSLSLRDSGLDTRVFRSNHAEKFYCLLSKNKWDQMNWGSQSWDLTSFYSLYLSFSFRRFPPFHLPIPYLIFLVYQYLVSSPARLQDRFSPGI